MNRYTWRTREDGMILIQDLPGAAERAPILAASEARIMDRVEEQWGPLCRQVGEAYGLPDGWIQATIYQESGGKADARNKEGTSLDPTDDGIGLMQITHPSLKGRRRISVDGSTKWVGGKTDAELFVPGTNLTIGAKYLSEQFKRYGNDFPRVAAAFNAGSARPPGDKDHENPWWLHSTGSHVSNEVAALNYWISKYSHRTKELEAPALISLVDMAREADDAARRPTDPPPKAA
jgi:soluble lytic murein transglycosylase-like protein